MTASQRVTSVAHILHMGEPPERRVMAARYPACLPTATHRPMRRLLLPLITLALTACAATPPQNDVKLAAVDKDTVCERETRTGSNFSTTRCRTAEQRQAEKEAVNQLGEKRRNFQAIMTGS